MRTVVSYSVVMFLLLLIIGCEDNGTSGRICTAEARVGIQVEIRDAMTRNPAAEGAKATVNDGSFIDTLRTLPVVPPQGSLTVYGVYERPGVYTVMITKPGYRDWVRSNVVVNKDECHVITAQIEALLEPVP